MVEEKSLESRKIIKTKKYLLDEIKHNDLMNEKYEKTFKYLNYAQHLFILVSTVTGFVSTSAFASVVCVPFGITNSAVGVNICAITAGAEKYKSVIEKKKKQHDKIVLLGKDKLNTIKVQILRF